MVSSSDIFSINFAKLAETDQDFAHVYRSSGGYLNFQDPITVQQLTKSILKAKFELLIELPDDRLCPPVQIRYEYILWLQSLIDTSDGSYQDAYMPGREVVGVDIGTGASCIYPLLGCASRQNWKFIGTDIDERSLQFAASNIALNHMQTRIRLVKSVSSGALIDLSAFNVGAADFVMCNPPFFCSKEEMMATHTTKKRSPSAVCTGAGFEMITEGGDLGFALRILKESMTLKTKIQWYSSMLGKLSSVYALVGKLKESGISNWAVTTLQAGNVTRRWAVAWSLDDKRPSNHVARDGTTAKDILPFPTEHLIEIPSSDREDLISKINQTIKSLDVLWSWENSHTSFIGTCFARANVWSRAARRKQNQLREEMEEGVTEQCEQSSLSQNAALGVRVKIGASGGMDLVEKIQVRWLKGYDSVLFESFCGMLRRTVVT